jgi:hypothetical protein
MPDTVAEIQNHPVRPRFRFDSGGHAAAGRTGRPYRPDVGARWPGCRYAAGPVKNNMDWQRYSL